MSLLRANQLDLAFGWRPLLNKVDFALENGDKIALLGRNGEGKSSLLNVIRGAQNPDSGEINISQNVRSAYLSQEPPPANDLLVREVVADKFQIQLQALNEYQNLHDLIHEESAYLQRLQELEDYLQQGNYWNLPQKIEEVLKRFQLNGEQKMSELSGGWRRRVALAELWLHEPQILLLDEPTNHLDIEAILWLEQLLLQYEGALIFVTHDRAFLQKVANRIWHLDRGNLLNVAGTYQNFLKVREEENNAEELALERFNKKLAEEEIWIRQGIKARRTRNEGRVRALKALRAEAAAKIKAQGQSKFNLDSGQRSGKQVIVAENISFKYQDDNQIINNFSDIIERGEKIGILGANGSGKSTLLKILLGELKPQAGTIQHGTKLQIAYFDQLRSALQWDKSLRDNVSQGSDFIELNGQKKHIASYLQDFLFPPERWNTPVSALSGGERARLLLAQLFSQPANVLVLDEPTNDLDIETLELLAELLSNYAGTVLIVSHDRQFLDEVIERLYVFNQKKNKIEHFVGGINDWLQQGGDWNDLQKEALPEKKDKNIKTLSNNQNNSEKGKKKLSYKYQRELEELPDKITNLEALLEEFVQETNSASFYEQDIDFQNNFFTKIEKTQQEIDNLYQRLLDLEDGAI